MDPVVTSDLMITSLVLDVPVEELVLLLPEGVGLLLSRSEPTDEVSPE